MCAHCDANHYFTSVTRLAPMMRTWGRWTPWRRVHKVQVPSGEVFSDLQVVPLHSPTLGENRHYLHTAYMEVC